MTAVCARCSSDARLFHSRQSFCFLLYMVRDKSLHLARRDSQGKREFTIKGMFEEHLIFSVKARDTAAALCPPVRRLEDFYPVLRTVIRNTVFIFLFSEFFILYLQLLYLRNPPNQLQRLLPAYRPADICAVFRRDIRFIPLSSTD